MKWFKIADIKLQLPVEMDAVCEFYLRESESVAIQRIEIAVIEQWFRSISNFRHIAE